MKIRTKTLFIIFLTLSVLVGSLTLLSQKVLIQGFTQVEESDVKNKAGLVRDAMTAMEQGIVSKAADWGVWDDAYTYVQDKNKKFEESNFAAASLPNLKLDALAFYDLNGKALKELGHNLDEDKAIPFSEGLRNYLKPNSVLLKHNSPQDEKSGILLTEEGAYIFVSRPVVDSEMKKPMKGTVFFARLLSPNQIKTLSETTHLNVSKYLFNQSDLPTEVVWSKSNLSTDKNTATLVKDENHIYGFALLNDYFSKPGIIFKVETPRAIFAVGRSSLSTMLWSIAASVFLFGIILVFSLEKTLVQRLVQITEQISLIKKDISYRLLVRGEDEISTLGSEMNTMLQAIEKNTKEIKSANGTINTMLNSLGQGFFVFNSDGLIDKNYSLACESLLESVPAGQKFHEVLKYPESDCAQWMTMLFLETISFESLAPLGPKTFPHSKGFHIGLSYYPVRDENQKIVQVVCIATDMTAEIQAKSDLEFQKSYVDRVVKMVKNKNEFINFINETRKIISFCENEFKAPNPDLSSLFRSIHTIKGGAGAFSMLSVQNFSHEFETQLSQLRSLQPHLFASKIIELSLNLAKLKSLFEQTIIENKDLLGESIVDGERRIEIPFNKIKKFYALISQSTSHEKLEHEFLNEFIAEPILKSFEYYNEVLESLASRLGKVVNPIEFIGGHLPIVHEPYSELFSSMIHALRNAVDHGLESPDERESQGKAMEGQIQIKFSKVIQKNNTFLKIEVKDDGRGIDVDKIKTKLQKSKISYEGLSDQQLLNKIFDAGFSTAEEITETSGRGVGMDAIYQACLKLKGTCEIETQAQKGTLLVVTVPFLQSNENVFSLAV